MPAEWVALLKDFGFPVVAVVAFVTGRIVARWTYDEMKADRDAWRAVAEKAVDALEDLGDVTDTAVKEAVRK